MNLVFYRTSDVFEAEEILNPRILSLRLCLLLFKTKHIAEFVYG